MLIAEGTELNTVFASFTTSLTNYCTVRAKHTAFAETVTIFSTFKAFSTIYTTNIGVARRTVATAIRADFSTFFTSFATGITESYTTAASTAVFAKAYTIFCTGVTKVTVCT